MLGAGIGSIGRWARRPALEAETHECCWLLVEAKILRMDGGAMGEHQ